MVCIGLVGCRHVHRPVTGYILVVLMIIGIIFGLRILLYVVASCLQRRRQSSTATDGQIEMQVRNAMAMHHYQQQWRRSAAIDSSSLPPDDWQSKLVIAAGDDHVSYIAQPCPHQP
ncbi:hypothetical protein COCNU_14G003580 [Cocos nucifera]|uniref:Uncharacterized protein n=1 Tax=Cocos nucifera TaxID=13894 RepID=A0A8K0IUM7_COCNU|nr:hypothetical protein COCNU_14G003580 [Cocos nucifera]